MKAKLRSRTCEGLLLLFRYVRQQLWRGGGGNVGATRDFFRGIKFSRRGKARRLTYKAEFKPFKTFISGRSLLLRINGYLL
jgi:hypothetical protein